MRVATCLLLASFSYIALLAPSTSLAQPLDEVPDASVGTGGADQEQEETDDDTGRVNKTCRQARDCDQGFTCENGRCQYTGPRKAGGGGCLGTVGVTLAVCVLGALAGRRRARPR